MQIEARTGYVKGEGGALFPIESTAHVTDPALQYDLDLEIRVLYGRPVCLSVTATQRKGGPPVTRSGLNSIPLEQIVREAAAKSAAKLRRSGETQVLTPATDAEITAIEDALRPRRGRRSDPAVRRALIERVCAMYQNLVNEGVKHPKPPIAAELGYSESYIGALVAEGRSEGLLSRPPGPGRAGTAHTSKSPRPRGRNP